MTEALRDAQQAGLRLHLFKIDVAVNSLGRAIAPTPELLQRQADKLALLVRTYRGLPRAQQFGITFWGVSDRDTWQRSYYQRDDYPLLFDDNYQPKPACCLLAQPLPQHRHVQVVFEPMPYANAYLDGGYVRTLLGLAYTFGRRAKQPTAG